MAKLRVQLVSSNDLPFNGHQLSAAFTHRVTIDGGAQLLEVPGFVTTAADVAGRAVLEVPSRDALVAGEPIALRVLAPDGEVLATADAPISAVDADQPVTIEVDPKQYFPVQPNTDPAYLKPDRIRGLVVDPTGRGRTADRQLVLRARPAGAATAAFQVVAVTRTDGRGYFSAPFPLGKFAEAQSVVSGGPPVPVGLNPDGTFPDRVVVGLELPADDDQGGPPGCDCRAEVPRDPDGEDLVNSPGTYSTDVGGGQCVNITKPNRVLEEFDFYTVVRTTEPHIRGLTIKEPPKIRLDDILRILDPKVLTLAVRAQPEAIERSAARTVVSRPARPTGTADNGRVAVPALDVSDAEALKAAALELRPELEHLSEMIGLASLRVTRGQAGEEPANPDAASLAEVRIEAEIAKTLTRDPDGFSLTRLASAEMLTRKNDLVRLLELIKRWVPQRGTLSCSNPVDWDDEPTFYQACTIAHGHILHLKQEWVADGYSLGDLLYSLPLAPCQKKQIVLVDWDRRESAARRESLEEQEFLAAQLSRDRDISEIANASVREAMSGGSEASASSFGAGLGIGAIAGPVGGLLGIGGGTSGASSSAWQSSSRDASANSLQLLRDRTQQSASAVRSQRSTVIQTVRQGESMRVQTEAVANHNHCHAITIEYFEVLRHFLVRQRLADVQECLLVPLLMTRFDSAKARRWREPLTRYLRNRRLERGFDALQRIADNYVGSDMPVGAYAEDQLVYMDGFIRIKFRIQRPRDNNDGTFLEAAWGPLSWLGISPNEWWKSYLESQQERDRIFAEVLGPRIAEEITNGLRFFAVDESNAETRLPIDSTLASDFVNDEPLYVSLRLNAGLPPLRRDRIKFVRIDTTVDTNAGPRNIDTILPAGSKVVVHSGQMGYRTPHLAHALFDQSRILNDLSGTDGILIFTPLSRQELRRPREEDKEYGNALLKHLNDHLEHYHRAIWWVMDPQRRFMLLDGFIAPNSGGRSVASVVENRPVGIVGNCLVLPVARGFHLDPTFGQNLDKPIDLLDHYQPTTPVAPLRIAVPTKGVFAESVMGACNSCEPKDESRFWRWEESPCPDEPTPIQPVSPESRRAAPPDLTVKEFPAPIVAFQNVPSAPDPQGFGGLLQLLGNPNLFRDITGLTENQRNALAGLQAALGTAQFFGGKAADLALQGAMKQDIDKALNKIKEQHAAGAITDQQRSQLTEAALRGMLGGGTQAPAQPLTTDEVQKLTRTAGANDASVNLTRPGGESLTVDAQPVTASLKEPLQTKCGFFGPDDTVVSGDDLRNAIGLVTQDERTDWFDAAGNALTEADDPQFGHLVFYWLSRFTAIRPTTLTHMQASAISGGINFGQLLNAGASNATVIAEARRVRADLLTGAPDAIAPANLNALVEQALRSARLCRLGHPQGGPWSAVFVVSCVRRTAIQLNLEGMAAGNPVGRDELLLGASAHRHYVREAFLRRFGPTRRDGTYHAFRVTERTPQVGDIIVLDRQANNINSVLAFDDIATTLVNGYALHADIVTEVNTGEVTTIGGNLGNGVRRRRYPLDATGHLVVAREQLFAQESTAGSLPVLPLVNAAAGLNDESTGRIFALLGLVEQCSVIPGQKVNGGVIV